MTLLDEPGATPAPASDPRPDGFAGFAAAVAADEAAAAAPVEAPLDDVDVPGLDRDGEEVDLREVLRTWGAAPLGVLFALNVVDELDRIAFTVLAPNLRDAFDLSTGALGGIATLGGVMTLVAALPVAVLAERRSRVRIAGITGLVWSVFAALTGFATNVAHLAVTRIGSGIGKASVEPVHSSLLADSYPVAARGRVFAAHQLANPAATVAGPLLVGGIVLALPGDGWRAGFLVPALLSVLAAVAAFRLREPARGRFERGDAEEPEPAPAAPAVTLASSMRRLLQIRTLRSMYFGLGILGFALFGAGTILSLYLEEHYGLGEGGRALVEPLGQAPGDLPLGAEAGQHIGAGEAGQGAEGPHPEAAEDVGELRSAQRGDRQGGEEGGRATRRHDPGAGAAGRAGGRLGGEGGGEAPVGDPDPSADPFPRCSCAVQSRSWRLNGAGTRGDAGQHRPRDGQHLRGEGVVAAEEASRAARGERHVAGRGDLDPGGDGVEAGHDRLESASVPGGVVLEHDQVRAAGLRLPAPLVVHHVLSPGRRRRGRHPVGVEGGSGHVERHPGRHDRPVRHVQGQGSGHRAPNGFCAHWRAAGARACAQNRWRGDVAIALS